MDKFPVVNSSIRVLPVLLLFALSACALSPGHKMDVGKISDDGSFESTQLELLTISPQLIAEQNRQQIKATVPAELLAYQVEDYRVGPADVLFITVWNHPELTAPSGTQLQGDANGRVVGSDGMLFYPFIGRVEAAGKTIEELRDFLAVGLARFIDKPQVDISVQRFYSQRVTLSGAFVNTNSLPITTRPLGLLDALGNAGVNLNEADLSALTLVRAGKSHTLNIYALTREPSDIHQVFLQDSDSLHLPYNDSSKIYLMGEVTRPQALVYKSGSTTLTDAIGSAGGLERMTARGQAVYVIRGVPDLSTEKAKIYQLNAKSPSAFILANNFHLQSQDVVYVGPANITRWNRVISQLLPSLSVLGLTANTLYNLDRLSD